MLTERQREEEGERERKRERERASRFTLHHHFQICTDLLRLTSVVLRHHQHAVLGCRLNVPHGQIKILPHICDKGRSLDLLVDVHQHARLLVDGQRLRMRQALGAEEVEFTIRRIKFAGIVVLDPDTRR